MLRSIFLLVVFASGNTAVAVDFDKPCNADPDVILASKLTESKLSVYSDRELSELAERLSNVSYYLHRAKLEHMRKRYPRLGGISGLDAGSWFGGDEDEIDKCMKPLLKAIAMIKKEINRRLSGTLEDDDREKLKKVQKAIQDALRCDNLLRDALNALKKKGDEDAVKRVVERIEQHFSRLESEAKKTTAPKKK